MGKKLREFATENIQMANKHMKRHLTFALIWDIKIKTELTPLLTYSNGQNLKD